MKRIILGFFAGMLIISIGGLYYASSQNIRHSADFIYAKNLALSDGDYQLLAEDVFTNGPRQYVFLLENSAHQRFWYFIHNGEIIKKVNATDGKTVEAITKQSQGEGALAYTEIFYVIPGVKLDNVLSSEEQPYYYQFMEGDLAWEIVGRNTQDRVQYTYLDFYTEKTLWSYELK